MMRSLIWKITSETKLNRQQDSPIKVSDFFMPGIRVAESNIKARLKSNWLRLGDIKMMQFDKLRGHVWGKNIVLIFSN